MQNEETVLNLLAESGRIEPPDEVQESMTWNELVCWRPGQEMGLNNRYLLQSFLGRGGFSLVFAALDLRDGNRVALKFINPDQIRGSGRERRIQREFEVAQKLRHPGLVRLHSLEKWRGINFLVMDLVEGSTLSARVAESGALDWTEAAPIIDQLLAVLGSIHGHGAVHRDIKPSNIIITMTGQAVLLDLGLTRELDDLQKTASTGELVGSPHYLPPELLLGQSAGPAADVYQLGLVLYFMLGGRHPFAEDEQETTHILGRQLTTRLKIPRSLNLPASTRAAFNLCLEKDPDLRPADATELAILLTKQGRIVLHRLLHWKPARLLRVLLISLLAISAGLFYFMPVKAVSLEGDELLGRNLLGRVLWRHSPDPGSRLAGWISTVDENVGRQLSAVYAPAGYPYSFAVDSALPSDYTIRRRTWDGKGRLQTEKDINIEMMSYFDFFPWSRLSEVRQLDIDGDRRPEMLISTEQALGMFPSLLTIWGHETNPIFSIFSPGRISIPTLLDNFKPGQAEKNPEISLLLTSNPFCHYYIWAWNISRESATVIPPSPLAFLFGSIKTTDLVFLPQHSNLHRNDWHSAQRVEVRSARSRVSLEIERSGLVRIKGFEETVFQENFAANSTALAMLNQAYFHLYRQEGLKAADILTGINTELIKNPWLLSLIFYFKAESKAQQGDLAGARRLFKQSLAHDPYNVDAANRVSELDVLEQGPLIGLELFEKQTPYSESFWGLAYGHELFRMACLLMGGDLAGAADSHQRMLKASQADTLDNRASLLGLEALHRNDDQRLERDLQAMLSPQSKLSTLFDLSELQLILARLLMARGDMSRAEPLLRHYTANSILHRPFAEVSLAWTEAGHDPVNAARRAERAFIRLEQMSRGQFWPRFWLFYDAYAYGQTMELAGQPEKARQGYRLCIELAPHSFLAQRSRQALADLNEKSSGDSPDPPV